jgi:hypothetical protein
MKNLLLSAALLAAFTVPSAAAIVTETDFTTTANGVTANPDSDLATATSVGVTTWTANEIVDALGGLTNGDVITMTNPILTSIGSLITISWDGGAFSDTTKTNAVSFVGDELDISGDGILHGPGVPTGTVGVLDLSFTQAGGTGDLISGSGSFTATSSPVGAAPTPEASTWAMMLIGGGFLAMFATRSRKRVTPLAA